MRALAMMILRPLAAAFLLIIGIIALVIIASLILPHGAGSFYFSW